MVSSRVVLSEDDICETYTTIRSDVGMGVSVEEADEGDEEGAERIALLKEIDKCVGAINGLLTDAGFEIKLAVMDKGARFYVFVNTQADTLAKNFGSKLTVEEMGFFSAGVETIIGIGLEEENEITEDLDDDGDKDSGDGSGVGSRGKLSMSKFIGLRTSPAALVDVPTVGRGGEEDEEGGGGGGGRSSIVKGKPISAKRAEKLLEKFIEDGWLGRGNRDNLVLGVRTYAELPDLCRNFGLNHLPQMVTLR